MQKSAQSKIMKPYLKATTYKEPRDITIQTSTGIQIIEADMIVVDSLYGQVILRLDSEVVFVATIPHVHWLRISHAPKRNK